MKRRYVPAAVFSALIALAVLSLPTGALAGPSFAAGGVILAETSKTIDVLLKIFAGIVLAIGGWISVSVPLWALTLLILLFRTLLDNISKKRREKIERLLADENARANATEREKKLLRDEELRRSISEAMDRRRPTPESKLTSVRQYGREIDPGFNEQSIISLAKNVVVDFMTLPVTKDITPLIRKVTPAMLGRCEKIVRNENDAALRFVYNASLESFTVLDTDIRGYYREDGRDVIVIELKTREGKRLKNPDPDDSPVSIVYYEVAAVRASGHITREDPLPHTDKCGNCGSPLVLSAEGRCSFCGALPEPREDEWAVDSVREVDWYNEDREPYKLQRKEKSEKSIERRKKLKSISPWIITALIFASFFVPAVGIFLSEKTGKTFWAPVLIFGMMGAWLTYGIVTLLLKDYREAAKPTPKRMLKPIKDYIAKVDPGFDPYAALKTFSDLFTAVRTRENDADLERHAALLSDEIRGQLSGQLDYVYIVNNHRMRVCAAELKRAVIRGWYREDGLDHLVMEFEAAFDLLPVSGDGFHANRRAISEWDVARTTGVVTGWDPVRTVSCPNCGAPVTVERSGKCPYCDHAVTVNEHDWMLCGMRELDYRSKNRKDEVRFPLSDSGRSEHE